MTITIYFIVFLSENFRTEIIRKHYNDVYIRNKIITIPMIYDIALFQQKYGAKFEGASGHDVIDASKAISGAIDLRDRFNADNKLHFSGVGGKVRSCDVIKPSHSPFLSVLICSFIDFEVSMKKFFVGLLCSALLCSGAAKAYHPLEVGCTVEEKSGAYWVNNSSRVDTIFIGKVISVDATVMDWPEDGSCWGNFSVLEVLKGNIGKRISVKIAYDPAEKAKKRINPEGLKTVDYCPFAYGKTYVVYGLHIKDSPDVGMNDWIVSNSNAGNSHFNCAPTKEIRDSETSKTSGKIRNLLKKGK